MIQEKKEIKLSLYYWLGELTSSGLAFIEYIIQSTDIKVSLCYFLWMLKKCDKNYRAKFVLRFRIIKCTAASWSTYDLIYLFQLLGWNQNLQKHDCFDEKFIILITIFSLNENNSKKLSVLLYIRIHCSLIISMMHFVFEWHPRILRKQMLMS